MIPNTGGTFEYVNPPTVHYGAGCIEALDPALQENHVTRAHIVTTRSLLDSDALRHLRSVSKHLQAAEVSIISAHVPLAGLRDIALDIRGAGANAVVALGGGSTIDAAKFASLATVSDILDRASLSDFRDILINGPTNGMSAPPVFCVPTTLSAAELEGGGGWTDNQTGEKAGALYPALTPRAVFYDPRVTAETPSWLWLATGVRALDHAVETLLPSQVNPISETLATSAVAELFDLLPRYAAEPTSESVRLGCQVAAWKSYTAPHTAATGLSHVLGRAVGAKNGIAHGITSCVILPQVVRFYSQNPAIRDRMGRLTEALGLTGTPAGHCALADTLEDLIGRLGLPTRFTRSELTHEAQRDAATRASQQLGLSSATVDAILESCVA